MQVPPLAGLRVVEVGNFMAGPFCAMQLADLGADVVKVEKPDGGDMTRQTGPFLDGESSNFIRLNRNKRSLALDLKSPDGKRIFETLTATADVVVENLRPGTMEDLQLGYARLSERNPRLIYLAASGWGQNGPYAARAGLDIMAQGMSGLMSITGEADGNPVKIGVPITDLTCALYGAIAVLAALRARERDGLGQYIDVSLLESGVSLAIWEAGKYFATGEIPQRSGSAHQTTAPYQTFRSSDGFFTFGATTPTTWSACCRVLGLERIEREPRFATADARRRNLDQLVPILEGVTTTQPTEAWLGKFEEAGIPCGKIQTYDQVFADPHLAERKFFSDLPHPKLGPVRQLGSPLRFSRTPVRMERAGPLLGADSADVLHELGFDDREIADFADRGITNGIPERV